MGSFLGKKMVDIHKRQKYNGLITMNEPMKMGKNHHQEMDVKPTNSPLPIAHNAKKM